MTKLQQAIARTAKCPQPLRSEEPLEPAEKFGGQSSFKLKTEGGNKNEVKHWTGSAAIKPAVARICGLQIVGAL